MVQRSADTKTIKLSYAESCIMRDALMVSHFEGPEENLAEIGLILVKETVHKPLDNLETVLPNTDYRMARTLGIAVRNYLQRHLSGYFDNGHGGSTTDQERMGVAMMHELE